MPASDTFQGLYGANAPAQGAYAIPSYSPAATTATIIPCQTSSTTPAVLTVGNGSYISGAATAPSFAENFDGNPFVLRIWGKVTTKASCNVTIGIALQNSITYTAGNVIASSGAIAVNTTSCNFFLSANTLWDVVTGKVFGQQSGQLNGTAVSATTFTNNVAAATQGLLQFVPVATFSDTTAGTTLTICGFTAGLIT